MADRVILLASSPSDLFRGQGPPRQMVEDLLAIAKIPRENLERLAASLSNAVGFLDEEKLTDLVKEVLPEERQASAIVNAIRSVRPGRVDWVLASLRDWRDADQSNAERVSEETLDKIRRKLSILIKEYPAWDRYQKAQRLASLTGNKAIHVDVICDLRPVLDSSREQIEGLIPLTTLKLVYESQTEETKCVEVLLSADVLEDLLEKMTKAQQKLTTLRETVDQWIPGGFIESPES
jgi:hypothetical protein